LEGVPLLLPPRAVSAACGAAYGYGVQEMCSGSEAGWYLRRIDFVHHSTLGLRVIGKKKKVREFGGRARIECYRTAADCVRTCHSRLEKGVL